MKISGVQSAPVALVTGATGAIGPILAQRLVAAGYQVKALVRHQPPLGLLPEPVELICGDIADSEALCQATTNVTVVFHLAAKLHLTNPSPALASEYERVNVEGTRCVVAAARAAGVQRLVYFSTISVYGPGDGQAVFSETSPLNPQTLYAHTKSRAEALVLAATQPDTGKPLGVVLRLAAIYGPRVKGNYARLIQALRRGWFVPVGPGLNRRTLVYEQDVATGAILAAKLGRAAGQIYNVTDGQPAPFNEILRAICQGLGRHPPRRYVPVYPLHLLAGWAEWGFGRLGRTPPVGRFTLAKLLEDVAVSGQKLQRELGFQPQYDLTRGWQATIEQMA
jgi:UDP-glucose 4-epimerase